MKKIYKNDIRNIEKMKEILGEVVKMKEESYLKILFETENIKIDIIQNGVSGDILHLQKENNELDIYLDSIGIYFRIQLDEEIKAKNYGNIIRKIVKTKTLLDLLDAIGKLNVNVSILKFLAKTMIKKD